MRLREDIISPEPVEWVTNSSINPLKGPNFRFVLSDYFTQFYATSSKALCEQISQNKRVKDGFRLVSYINYVSKIYIVSLKQGKHTR